MIFPIQDFRFQLYSNRLKRPLWFKAGKVFEYLDSGYLTACRMERREINPLILHATVARNNLPRTTHQPPRSTLQLDSNPEENIHYVAQNLAWIGDQIEMRITSAQTRNTPRTIGRCLASAGDNFNWRYNPFARRNKTFLRLLWRSFSEQDDVGFVFAGVLLQAFYLAINEVSLNL